MYLTVRYSTSISNRPPVPPALKTYLMVDGRHDSIPSLDHVIEHDVVHVVLDQVLNNLHHKESHGIQDSIPHSCFMVINEVYDLPGKSVSSHS